MKKNILFLIGNLSNGGAERSIVNVANEMSKIHNVILVCCNNQNPDFDCNVKIIEIPELRFQRQLFTGIKKLRKLKKEYKIDVTISYITVYNFFNCITKKNDTTIISVRNYLSKKEKGLCFYLINRLSGFLCDKMVCCSENVKYDQIKTYRVSEKKIFVIENFCNDFILEQMNQSIERKYQNKDLIVSISRLEEHKGVEHIVKAFSFIHNKNVQLLIFGKEKEKSDELNYLKTLVSKYHLEKKVSFMGFYSNPFSYLKLAKVFVLASDYEGFPNAIIEAMMCGCPVISTDSFGGVEEIIADKIDFNHSTNTIRKEKYGILVPNFILDHRKENITDNEEKLSEAIQLIINDSKNYQYYHKKSLERIHNYSKDKIMKKWFDVI